MLMCQHHRPRNHTRIKSHGIIFVGIAEYTDQGVDILGEGGKVADGSIRVVPSDELEF